jgi:hypothetical protein
MRLDIPQSPLSANSSMRPSIVSTQLSQITVHPTEARAAGDCSVRSSDKTSTGSSSLFGCFRSLENYSSPRIVQSFGAAGWNQRRGTRTCRLHVSPASCARFRRMNPNNGGLFQLCSFFQEQCSCQFVFTGFNEVLRKYDQFCRLAVNAISVVFQVQSFSQMLHALRNWLPRVDRQRQQAVLYCSQEVQPEKGIIGEYRAECFLQLMKGLHSLRKGSIDGANERPIDLPEFFWDFQERSVLEISVFVFHLSSD